MPDRKCMLVITLGTHLHHLFFIMLLKSTVMKVLFDVGGKKGLFDT